MGDDNNNNNIKNTIAATSAKYDNRGRDYYHYGDSYSEERKINLITEGLEPRYAKALANISKENALAIVEFILNTKITINLSDNHRRNYISLLPQLSNFYHNKKSFKEMNREDILLFIDSFRKPENSDLLHKWVGTYNQCFVALFGKIVVTRWFQDLL